MNLNEMFADHEKPGLKLGAHSYCGLRFANHFNIPVNVGKYTSIAGNVSIVGGFHPGLNDGHVSTFPFNETFGYDYPNCHDRGPVTVGNDVWIGMHSFIFSGVTIGDGAVIGACSVVARDVAPYQVVAGNPCKHLYTRFDEWQVKALLSIQWWNWPDEVIKQRMTDFHDVYSFIKKCGY